MLWVLEQLVNLRLLGPNGILRLVMMPICKWPLALLDLILLEFKLMLNCLLLQEDLGAVLRVASGRSVGKRSAWSSDLEE